jgi:hypothetical protein
MMMMMMMMMKTPCSAGLQDLQQNMESGSYTTSGVNTHKAAAAL